MKLVVESLFAPATVGGVSLMQVSGAIAPIGGSNYGSSIAYQVVISVIQGQQYFVMSGVNEANTTFNNGTQAQPIATSGQSFTFTAQGASVNFTSALTGQAFTGSVQPAAIVGTVPAQTTRSVSCQRLRVFSQPTNAITIKILGKMAYVPMTYPFHESMIKASSQTVMAFALASMLKRARQYAKADLEEKKASALLLECAKLHSVQRSNNQRFVPEAGFGDTYWGPSHQGLPGFMM